jgi:sec-independent protein translocase protein TatA
MPFGARLPELLIFLVIALLIFGPKKLPEIGASIGQSIKALKKGMSDIENADKEKEANQEQNLLEQRRTELEALEREIASKKAETSAYEAAQAEHASVGASDSEFEVREMP